MKKQRGFTIVELMIGITIGFVVIALAFVLFSSTLFANTNGVKQSQLEQTVHALVSTMSADIRRAGYTTVGQTTPTLPVNGSYIYSNGDCLLLAYIDPATNAAAYRGYVWANNAIHVLNRTTIAPATCTVTDTVTWDQTPVTDSSQVIVLRPTTAPSASGTQSTLLFQADGNHPTLMWIHFTLTSKTLTNQIGDAITRDVVAAVNLRN